MQKSDSEIDQVRREAAFCRLRRCLQALALPAGRQKQLFPPLVELGDELALEFDNYHRSEEDLRTYRRWLFTQYPVLTGIARLILCR